MIRQIYFYMMPFPILKILGLSLISPNGHIVRDLNLEIEQGEIVALTGPSGSGKTSIAMAILGLLPEGVRMVEGEIQFRSNKGRIWKLPEDNHEWNTLRGSHIAFIQQDVYGAFDPVIRMGKQLLMILSERKLDNSADLLSELKLRLTETGIEDAGRILDSYPHQLSGGQLQRCLVCLAIILQPTLIIADEPTSAIDKANQIEMVDLFSHIRTKYHISILCITHEPDVVALLADREIRLDSGFTGSKENLRIVKSSTERVVLEVENLSYEYNYGGILSKRGARITNIDFTLNAGQCLGIIGESGSGKSSVAHMLVGLLIPEKGTIKISSRPINYHHDSDIRFLRSKVQLVMQDGRGSLHPHKSIRKLLAEIAPDNHLTKALAEVGLSGDVLDRKQGQLSGGECLRICIARAIMMNPEILICDESTTSLDIPTRNSIMNLLLDLKLSRGLALILISHDQELITQMANKVLVLSEGTIIKCN